MLLTQVLMRIISSTLRELSYPKILRSITNKTTFPNKRDNEICSIRQIPKPEGTKSRRIGWGRTHQQTNRSDSIIIGTTSQYSTYPSEERNMLYAFLAPLNLNYKNESINSSSHQLMY
jgi:hypothetical protein